MTNEDSENKLAEDGLYVDSDTTTEDIKEFLKRRAENPIVIDNTVIWDFCGYPPNEEALEAAVKHKLRGDKYIIPFQVTGTWGFLFHLLPEDLRDAEILVYDTGREMYNAYRNYSRDLSSEQEDTLRRDLARRVADSEPDPLTFDG